MAPVVRIEPSRGENVKAYDEYLAMFKQVGWWEFI